MDSSSWLTDTSSLLILASESALLFAAWMLAIVFFAFSFWLTKIKEDLSNCKASFFVVAASQSVGKPAPTEAARNWMHLHLRSFQCATLCFLSVSLLCSDWPDPVYFGEKLLCLWKM